jgi:hypothetical protein
MLLPINQKTLTSNGRAKKKSPLPGMRGLKTA